MPWVTRKVKIEEIGFTPHSYTDVSLPKVLEYSRMPADTAPPIDVIKRAEHRYDVENGLHRIGAAWIRGDKEVLVRLWEA